MIKKNIHTELHQHSYKMKVSKNQSEIQLVRSKLYIELHEEVALIGIKMIFFTVKKTVSLKTPFIYIKKLINVHNAKINCELHGQVLGNRLCIKI